MQPQTSHRLLIYHRDPELYEEAIQRRLPRLEIHSAERSEQALPHIEEAEIILSWKLPDDLIKRAKRLVWFASTAAGNENLVKNPFPRQTLRGSFRWSTPSFLPFP